MSESPDEEAASDGPGGTDRAPFRPRGYWGPPGQPWPPPEPAVPPGKPRPGHGTVLVNNHGGTWSGLWDDSASADQEGGPVVRGEDFEGSKEEVLRWARSRPAAEFLIFSSAANDYVPLPRDKD